MPNERLHECPVRCWFCEDEQEGVTRYYGSVVVSGVTVPACETCSERYTPGFERKRWYSDSIDRRVRYLLFVKHRTRWRP